MIHKKGFTLLEVTISIALLSFVMVFMFRLLNMVRKDENAISLTTELLLNKSILSKNLNESIKKSKGISSSTCTETLCTFNMNDGTTKDLKLTNNNTVIELIDTTNNQKEVVRELPNDFNYKIRRVDNEYLTLITIIVNSHEEYNVEIVDKKI